MLVGKLYKSVFNDTIVRCTGIIDCDQFAGYVVDKGKSAIDDVGDYATSWQKDMFELCVGKISFNSNPTPTSDQIGGSHYKNLKIQPTEFIHANNIGFIEGNIIKYVVRHKDKNGLEDLNKAKHYIDLLIKFEYEDPKKF